MIYVLVKLIEFLGRIIWPRALQQAWKMVLTSHGASERSSKVVSTLQAPSVCMRKDECPKRAIDSRFLISTDGYGICQMVRLQTQETRRCCLSLTAKYQSKARISTATPVSIKSTVRGMNSMTYLFCGQERLRNAMDMTQKLTQTKKLQLGLMVANL